MALAISPLAAQTKAPKKKQVAPQSSSSQAAASVPDAPAPAKSGSPVNIDVSPQLFATMCALYAAGLPAQSSALASDLSFVNLFAQLRQVQGPATDALRKFYRDHVLADPGETVARYVAFAVVAGPAPKFSISLRSEEVPPEVSALDGFSEILANFYQEAELDRRWSAMEPVYQRLMQPMNEPVGRVVLTETSYLRELLRNGPRTFTVYAEPMVGGHASFRNIGDQYIVVANPSLDSLDEIRHAFFHFLLDPLPLQHFDQLVRQSKLLQIAGSAPRLPSELRNDWSAFYAECLVRAVELRVRRLPPAQLAAEVNSAEGDGYVLVRPLVAGLAKFEMSEPSMTLYFMDLAHSIDAEQEQARLSTVTFAPAPAKGENAAAGTGVASSSSTLEPDIEASLTEGERFIAAQQAPAAAEAFERVLAKAPGQPRALYGLAVASVLQGKGEQAVNLFEQVVAAAPSDANVLAWSHVYLGRMYDLAETREEAVTEYKAALSVAGAPEAARNAAQRGIEQAYKPAGHGPSSE